MRWQILFMMSSLSNQGGTIKVPPHCGMERENTYSTKSISYGCYIEFYQVLVNKAIYMLNFLRGLKKLL